MFIVTAAAVDQNNDHDELGSLPGLQSSLAAVGAGRDWVLRQEYTTLSQSSL